MPIRFTEPWFLILLLGIPWFVWLSRRSLADMAPLRRKTALGVRITIALLLILALSGFQFISQSQALSVLFVLDRSDSISADQKDAQLEYINEAVRKMGSKDTAGVVVFGTDAWVELSPDSRLKITRIQSIPSTAYTDIAQAIRLAVAAFPQNSARRIVLISDGNENLGSAIEEATIARANDVQIDVIPMTSTLVEEAMLDKIVVPAEIKIGEPFEIKIIAESLTEQTAVLTLLRNGKYIGQQEVSLSPGKNIFTCPQNINKPGFYNFECRIDPSADTRSENNVALGFTLIKGKPRVLLIEGDQDLSDQGKYLRKALAEQKIDLEVRSAAGIPNTTPEFMDYDSVILSDVSAWNLTPDQMLMIERNVRELGMGFGMIGGQESFGAGGYYKTPIEETLPVDMDLRKQKHFPSVGIAVVIDKSGSMGMGGAGFAKVDLAKEAAIEVVELLSDQDMISVVCFDEGTKVVAPMQSARNKVKVEEAIASIFAGGGTSMYPALMEAGSQLRKADTKIKHVMLMTDGMSLPGDFDHAIRKLKSINATISTVAIGTDADVKLLQHIAKTGGGRFYFCADPHHLPRIFTREAMIAAKSAVIEEPFNARPVEGDPVIEGIDWGSAPILKGYVATSPKPMADMALMTHKNDPLFAHWRHGLGRSFAFTSDAKGRWAQYWLLWSGFNKFWAQTIRWSLRRTARSNFQVMTEIDCGRGHVVVDAITPSGEFINYLKPKANIVSPGLKAEHLTLQQSAPGRYEGWFDAREVGNYMVGVSYTDANGSTETQTSGVVVSYPPEYKNLAPNRFVLTRVAEISSGRTLDPANPSEAFKGNRIAARIPHDLWMLFLLLAALLFPADVAVRRVMVDWTEVRQAWAGSLGWIAERRRARAARKKIRQESLGRLLDTKSRVQTKVTGTEAVEATEAARKLREALRASRDAQPIPDDSQSAPKPAAASGSSMAEHIAAAEAAKSTDSKPEVHHAKPEDTEPVDPSMSATERLLAAKRRAKQ